MPRRREGGFAIDRAGRRLAPGRAQRLAGSGAKNPVNPSMIKAVKANIEIPILVGGGIRTLETLTQAFDAGADIIVVGNVFETKPNLIADFVDAVKAYNI